jgi:hypothetical protein
LFNGFACGCFHSFSLHFTIGLAIIGFTYVKSNRNYLSLTNDHRQALLLHLLNAHFCGLL